MSPIFQGKPCAALGINTSFHVNWADKLCIKIFWISFIWIHLGAAQVIANLRKSGNELSKCWKDKHLNLSLPPSDPMLRQIPTFICRKTIITPYPRIIHSYNGGQHCGWKPKTTRRLLIDLQPVGAGLGSDQFGERLQGYCTAIAPCPAEPPTSHTRYNVLVFSCSLGICRGNAQFQ